MCASGKVTVDPEDGDVIGCVTEMAWALRHETPVANANVVMCGAGSVTRTKVGGIASCTSFGEVMVGVTEIAKQSLVTVDDKLAVTSATGPDGRTRCFDPAGAIVPLT